ncbi:ion channel [Limnohabitans sp.]|uniref:ion channel n=1 Tax=Limnohabitans sp. TaxID=1907725 RepID=UPI0038F775DB
MRKNTDAFKCALPRKLRQLDTACLHRSHQQSVHAQLFNDIEYATVFFFTSIPAAMRWCMVTLTTAGYGDMFPLTFGGRVIAALATRVKLFCA